MLQTQVESGRNQSIECARLVAAALVVFIHCPFPGLLGGYLECLGRYAVPLFFVISGYFSFRTSDEKILGRMKHVLKLYLLAVLMYLIWNVFKTEYSGGSTGAYLISAVPEINEVARWMFLNVPPYVGHLWYLLAMVTCYLLLWVYVRFFGQERVNYRPLYFAGFCLLVNQITTGAIMEKVETAAPFYWGRTAFLFGIPMFTLGIFVREYQERICSNFKLTSGKLLVLLLACVALSLIQWRGGINSGSMEFGTILGVVVLMLLLSMHPVIAAPESVAGRCISRLGVLSMAVYILHLMVISAYKLLLLMPMEALLGEREPWLRPILVLGITLLCAIVWDRIAAVRKRNTGRR